MQTTWRGERSVIVSGGRTWLDFDTVRHWVGQLEWAHSALMRPNETFPNGKELHECANEVIEEAEDVLLEFQVF
jgi:hypothetical protein